MALPAGSPARSSKSSWKDRLSDEQLNRKRASDRQQVRESRNRFKDTIAVLQRRLDLLSQQQSDRVVHDLMKANAILEEEKQALEQRLRAVGLAMGMKRDASCDLVKSALEQPQSERQHSSGIPETTISSSKIEPTRPSAPTGAAMASGEMRHNVLPAQLDDTPLGNLAEQMNHRMLANDALSPFPRVYAAMDSSMSLQEFSDGDFIEAIILWRGQLGGSLSIFDLAATLFHIHRAPSSMTRQTLREIAAKPKILTIVTRYLKSGQHLTLTTVDKQSPPSEPTDTVAQIKKEIAVAAYEAIRPWKYLYRNGKLAMFWAVYRLLTLLAFPTPQNLAKCPVWYRPLWTQLSYEHPSFIDLVPWPQVRAHLVFHWEKYRGRQFLSTFSEYFDIFDHEGATSETSIYVNAETEIELTPWSEKWLQNLQNYRMRQGFLEIFPEFVDFEGFTGAVQEVSSNHSDAGPTSHLSDPGPDSENQLRNSQDAYEAQDQTLLLPELLPPHLPISDAASDHSDHRIGQMPLPSNGTRYTDMYQPSQGDFSSTSQQSIHVENQLQPPPRQQNDNLSGASGVGADTSFSESNTPSRVFGNSSLGVLQTLDLGLDDVNMTGDFDATFGSPGCSTTLNSTILGPDFDCWQTTSQSTLGNRNGYRGLLFPI